MTTAEPAGEGDAARNSAIAGGEEWPADRSHNRATLTSEAMTEMLRDMQDALLALGQRVDELEAVQGRAGTETRQLAVSVVEMGDALAKRVKVLEHMGSPVPTSPLFISPLPRPLKLRSDRPLSWSIGLGLAFGAILGAFWFLRSEILDQPLTQAATRPVSAADPAGARVVMPATVPARASPSHDRLGVGATRRPPGGTTASPQALDGHELHSRDAKTASATPPS